MKNKKIDIIIAGGGTSGCAAAISASRSGASVLIIEEQGFLGGTATATYVTPMMKTILSDGTNIGGDLYKEILQKMKHQGYAETNFDNNPGWFIPEMMKFTLDEIMEEEGIETLFHTQVLDINIKNNAISSIKTLNKAGISEYSAKYYIDATGDALIAAKAGVPFEIGQNNISQAMSHRFVMSGVDIIKFAEWLKKTDPDENVSPVHYTEKGDILLTTAYTSEDKGWALKPIFLKAIEDGILKNYDAEYFQIFSVPGQHSSIYFNCPRIYSPKPLSPLCPEDISYAQIMGRKQIKRLAAFCNNYLPGFEKAYITNIANNIGIRDSRRIKGKYTLTGEDLINCKKFKNAVAKSNYPIDIHSNIKGKGGLHFLKDND
ncbi:MAG: FAD-dependent oxidoreductase, partial [Vampirovibrionia bacterium]